jgi:DNA-binding response OmpR family regulator
MILQALLVSKDDEAAETLIKALAQFGVAVDRSSAAEVAQTRLAEEHFDQVLVDFDEPQIASALLQACRQPAPDGTVPVTVALVRDASQIRSILGSGAHFILPKPVSPEQAESTLRASTALLKRERRLSFRVAVQTPISIRTDVSNDLEGILLDLSNGGMDVLVAKPLPTGALVRFSFELPDTGTILEGSAEVAWGNANGQTGLRFLDMEPKTREQLGEWLTNHSQEALPEEPDPVCQCKLTDLSLGGCYVETASPFPQCSAVDLCLRAVGMEIHTEGLVRVMHPGRGMGVEFPARTEEQRKSVGEFIEFLTSRPGATPELESLPRALCASAGELNRASGEGNDLDDPLVELLRRGNTLEEQDFLSQLHSQRSSAGVAQ